MVKQRKHSSSKASDFFNYASGKTSGKDRNAFERRLQKDPFEAEAAEGLGMVSRDEMEEDLRAAGVKIQRRIRRRRRITWYSAAAAVASLMIVATVFFNIDDGSMDRFRPAPEFEEAAQEQVSLPEEKKEEPGLDAIPDPTAGPSEKRMQGVEVNKNADGQQVMQEDVNQEKPLQPATPGEKSEAPVAIGEAVNELAPDAAEDVTAVEVAAMEASKQEITFQMEMDAQQEIPEVAEKQGAAAPAETAGRKRTARETLAVPTVQQVVQDEIPDAEMVEPLQNRIREAEAAQPVPAVLPGEQNDQVMEAREAETGQPLRTEALQEGFEPSLNSKGKEAVQPLQTTKQEEETGQALQGQVSGVDISRITRGQVSGIVYSAEDLEPIPGVSLYIKGSTTGTVSDLHGNFTLNTTDVTGNILVATSIGMQTEEIPLDANQPLEIAMVPDAVQLDEVVVVGHAAEQKSSLTGVAVKVEPDPVTSTEYITASPVEGITRYRSYMDSTLVYPIGVAPAEKEVVVLKFSITPAGRPNNFRVIRSPGESFTREAIRAITEGPDWNPAARDGKYVDDDVRLRIVFRPR